MGVLDGKVAIITGSGSFAREIAIGLTVRGAEVTFACRDPETGDTAAMEIRYRIPRSKVNVSELDLGSQDSVRVFAETYKKSGKPLHLLIAAAGADLPNEQLTTDGVPLNSQVNYLGHYTLARLLEPVLISSAPSRIISVTSSVHRLTSIPSAAAFLTQKEHAEYGDTKLALLYFTYEAQKRLGHLGVDACAVDPGGVRAPNLTGKYARPPTSWYINTFLAPPWDGARNVLHAATVNFGKEAPPTSSWPEANVRKDLRHYAKGAFATPLMTCYEGPSKGLLSNICLYAFMVSALFASLVDWPVRYASTGMWFATTTRCLSTRLSYDPVIAKELWELSANIAKVPIAPQLPVQPLDERNEHQ